MEASPALGGHCGTRLQPPGPVLLKGSGLMLVTMLSLRLVQAWERAWEGELVIVAEGLERLRQLMEARTRGYRMPILLQYSRTR